MVNDSLAPDSAPMAPQGNARLDGYITRDLGLMSLVCAFRLGSWTGLIKNQGFCIRYCVDLCGALCHGGRFEKEILSSLVVLVSPQYRIILT